MPPPPLTTIFAKRPTPGAVKTRLVPPLDGAGAAALASAMLEDALAAHRAEPSYATSLAVAPRGALAWFRERYPDLEVAPQEGTGLGKRLAAWFERSLAVHLSVVVVGADCPLLTPATVRAAHERLAAGPRGPDVVLAPDTGGGYALVGLARPAPELFDVPMSRPDNLERTLDRAAGLGLAVELFPEQRDVDQAADLTALARELRTRIQAGRVDPPFPRRTSATLDELNLQIQLR